jgi:hypothetical protein
MNHDLISAAAGLGVMALAPAAKYLPQSWRRRLAPAWKPRPAHAANPYAPVRRPGYLVEQPPVPEPLPPGCVLMEIRDCLPCRGTHPTVPGRDSFTCLRCGTTTTFDPLYTT